MRNLEIKSGRKVLSEYCKTFTNTVFMSDFNFAGCARIYPWTTSTAVWIWTWRTQWTTCSRARSWSPPGTRSTPTLATTDKCCRWAISRFCTYFPNFSAHFRFQLFFMFFCSISLVLMTAAFQKFPFLPISASCLPPEGAGHWLVMVADNITVLGLGMTGKFVIILLPRIHQFIIMLWTTQHNEASFFPLPQEMVIDFNGQQYMVMVKHT